jgi:class 3 adenylate cyclase
LKAIPRDRVVFCDLRGYTAFAETAEPGSLDFLREYHGALGPLVSQYEGFLPPTLSARSVTQKADPSP